MNRKPMILPIRSDDYEEELDRVSRLYTIRDELYLNTCIGYMYGRDLDEAAEIHGRLSETEIANACDYFSVRKLPSDARSECYRYLQRERDRIAKEYGLSPIEAIMKRDGLQANLEC